MSKPDTVLQVENEARKVLGDRAFEWMRKPSKLLDGMAPAEVATSREGARVVVVDVNVEGGEGTMDLIEEAGGQAAFVRADVSIALSMMLRACAVICPALLPTL